MWETQTITYNSDQDIKRLNAIIRKTKIRLLDMHHRSNSGHIGGNISCLDALVTLYHTILHSHDRFILSKGHSAGAWYATLWSVGKLTDEELDTFCADNTLLPAHPSGEGIPDLLFSTGSLGHGPSLAAGLALAARHQKTNRHIYCLCSDGEWQEGSCWEALIFASHQKLSNLTILIDQNAIQGFGRTSDVISCDDLYQRLSSFGALIISIDGHDPEKIKQSLQPSKHNNLKIIILNTIKGFGLHFENSIESHYLPMTDGQYYEARQRFTLESTV